MNHLGYILMNPAHEDFLAFTKGNDGAILYAYSKQPDQCKVFLSIEEAKHFLEENELSLVYLRKSQVILTQQGLQRIHEFLLQDQSAKLLPKERVCNCLKTH